MRRRFLVFTNPGAGFWRPVLAEASLRLLERGGADVRRVTPPDVASLRREVRAAAQSGDYDAIVAVGGDGTVRQMAAALLGSATPLGLIPAGTGNVLAHEIGLARTPADVVRTLVEGVIVPVPAARANGEPFLLMAGAGFDGHVVAALDQRLKSRIGKLAYAGPMLGALVKASDTLSVSVDGHPHEATWAVVSNACHYGGRFVLARRTSVHQHGLEAVLFRSRSRAELLAQLLSLMCGGLTARATAGRGVEMLSCTHVTITSHRPVPVQIDGDSFGTTPLEIEAGSDAVRLIMPAAPGTPARG
ncbi:MAG TPA: diacylglycerol kinase family protein [Hyphomicrobiaceae bacterium]|jgi:diacylglycerol kinase family enzyme|nr:diacylglycerol kinase family protein [Hyphomicrobiaceae bacterium]